MLDIREIRNNKKDIINKLQAIQTELEFKKVINREIGVCQSEIKNSFDLYFKDILAGLETTDNYKYSSIDLKNIKMQFNLSNYDKDTVLKADHYIMLIEANRKLLKSFNYYANIQELLDDANQAFINPMFWMFKSAQSKEDIISAVNQLMEIYSGSFSKESREARQLYSNYKSDNYMNNFRNNTNLFVNEINKLVVPTLYAEYDPPEPNFFTLQKNVNRICETNYQNSQINDLIKSSKENLIKAVNFTLNDETNRILESISIDELNRNRNGFKLQTLKNSGFITVSDILNSSAFRLSSIHGISDTSAYDIMLEANKIKESTTKNIKFRLNIDDKTNFKTELLRNLIVYIKNRDCSDNFRVNQYDVERSKRLESFFLNKTNKLHWMMLNNQLKHNYVDCIEGISDILESDFYSLVREIYPILKNNNILNITSKDAWDFFEQNSALCYSVLDELFPGLFGNSDTFYGLPEELAKEIEEECIFPDGLLVKLRRYQEWGVKYILHQKQVLLGDEMGLGKTIQAIAAMVSLKNTGAKHFLVVCPASVVVNWCREIEKHSKLKALKIHGKERSKMLKTWIKSGGVAVTTYETTAIIKLDDNFKYSQLIVDEAHYIKNIEAQRTQNVIRLAKNAERKLYMTGTALENKVEEMIELIDHLRHDIALDVEKVKFLSTAESFKNKIAPVYYRRKREDVLTELPDLIQNKEWCSLNPNEKTIYERNVLARKHSDTRQVSWNVDNLDDSCKAQRLKEIIKMAKEENRKVIIFSFFLNTIKKISEYLDDEISKYPITGAVSPQKRQEIIDKFDKAPAGSALICQIQAGGTGLNIQSASVVVITEPQFKPSIENQAISRAYRMGQTRNVLVYRLLCENTVDEKLMDVLEDKQMIFDTFADDSVAANISYEIDSTTFGDIIEEEIERINKEKNENIN